VRNETGGIGVLAGGARAMPPERYRGKDYTNNHKMKGDRHGKTPSYPEPATRA